jgi:hypothetical protein
MSVKMTLGRDFFLIAFLRNFKAALLSRDFATMLSSGIVRLNQYGRLFRSNPFKDWTNLYVWLALAKHQQFKTARDPLKKYSK